MTFSDVFVCHQLCNISGQLQISFSEKSVDDHCVIINACYNFFFFFNEYYIEINTNTGERQE